MNSDDFEKQLGRRPLRPLPAEWRAEILDTARSAAAAEGHTVKSRSPDSFLVNLWRELFWAGRRVWVGFACVWLFIVVANSLTSDSPSVVADAPHPNRAQILALQAQHQLLRQMLEQEPPPKPSAPDRRSDRHAPVTLG